MADSPWLSVAEMVLPRSRRAWAAAQRAQEMTLGLLILGCPCCPPIHEKICMISVGPGSACHLISCFFPLSWSFIFRLKSSSLASETAFICGCADVVHQEQLGSSLSLSVDYLPSPLQQHEIILYIFNLFSVFPWRYVLVLKEGSQKSVLLSFLEMKSCCA